MIPTLILFGILFGRWWRVTLIMAAIGWPALLLLSNNGISGSGELATAAFLALANTGAGVLVYQAVRHLIHRRHS